MATIHLQLETAALRQPTDVNVFIPEGEGVPAKRPVLWLLHGMHGFYSDWARLTSLERYAREAGLAVVMPSGANSFYEDMAHGEQYYTYITEELRDRVFDLFPISRAREDNYIAGLSMGGYGAMKLGLRHPERYAAAASFSGVLDLQSELTGGLAEQNRELFCDIFGEQLLETMQLPQHADLFALLKQHKAAGTSLPALYAWCGTEDFLYQANLRFKALCAELDIPLDYHEAPGTHEWGFWDMAVKAFIIKIRELRG